MQNRLRLFLSDLHLFRGFLHPTAEDQSN